MKKVLKEYSKFFLLVPVSIIIYILILIVITYPVSEVNIEKAGQLGDSFGVLNSLFSGLAFIAIFISIYLQKEDLENTKRGMQKQNFENSFFNLINIHNNSIQNFKVSNYLGDGKEYEMYGGAAISFFLDQFKKQGIISYDPNVTGDKERATKERNSDSFWLKHNMKTHLQRSNLKFVETIYLLFETIDKEPHLNSQERKFYLDAIFAQISDEELAVIFYYTHGVREDKKSLIEKFHIFENLDEQLLYYWESEVLLYNKEAYGNCPGSSPIYDYLLTK